MLVFDEVVPSLRDYLTFADFQQRLLKVGEERKIPKARRNAMATAAPTAEVRKERVKKFTEILEKTFAACQGTQRILQKLRSSCQFSGAWYTQKLSQWILRKVCSEDMRALGMIPFA